MKFRLTTARIALLFLLCSPLTAQDAFVPLDNGESADEIISAEETVVKAFTRSYKEETTSTALGFEADPKNVPLTTVSVPMDILEDQQVNNVDDALRNVSGVTKFKAGNGGEEKFSIRGFDASQSLYKDGARINNAFNATNIATTETANIERFDVLKGPAAILYGQGEPGGVINYITKKPLWENYGTIEGIIGSYAYYRTEFDVTGPLGKADSPFAFRFIASYEDSEADRDFIFRERLLLAPSVSWKPSDASLLTFQYEYITDDYTQDRGQVLDGNNLTGYTYSGRLDNSQFFGVPGFNDNTNSEYHRFGLLFDHEFSENARFKLNASTTRVDKTLFDSSPRISNSATGEIVNAAGNVTIRPGGQGGIGESDTITARQEFDISQGEIGGQEIGHKIMLGADYETLNNDGVTYTTNTPTIMYNVNTRLYAGIPAGGVQFTGSAPGVQTDVRQYGFVLQDLVSIGEKWHVLLGGRYTYFDERITDNQDKDFSPRIGVVYRPLPELSFYGNYATGFLPTTATGVNPATGTGIGGPVLDPEGTEQIEFGVKWDLLDGALELNAAIFDLRKTDIVLTDPASLLLAPADQFSSNFGETRTRGFDIQAVGNITDAFRLIGGYAYLDNELTEVDPRVPGQLGNRLPGIAEHSFNIWGVYEIQEGPLTGLGFGAGVFAQSESFVSTENRATYDGWVTVDSLLYYKRDSWKAQLNVRNLFGEDYNLAQAGTTTDSFGAIRVGNGAPRTVQLSLSYQF